VRTCCDACGGCDESHLSSHLGGLQTQELSDSQATGGTGRCELRTRILGPSPSTYCAGAPCILVFAIGRTLESPILTSSRAATPTPGPGQRGWHCAEDPPWRDVPRQGLSRCGSASARLADLVAAPGNRVRIKLTRQDFSVISRDMETSASFYAMFHKTPVDMLLTCCLIRSGICVRRTRPVRAALRARWAG
jgi:hypothetical protein